MTIVQYLEDTEIYQNHFANDVPYPYLAMIESSSRCNLLCIMCPRTVGKSPSSGTEYGDLPLELLDKVESLLPHLDQVVLSWIGEPLLNRRIGEIVDRIKRWPIHVHITTNGMLLNDHYAELVVSKHVDSVAVSIDGASDEVFEKIRAGGSLERIKENIRRLQDAKASQHALAPFLQIAFVAQPDNVAELPDMVEMVKSVGVHQLTVSAMDDFLLPQDLNVSEAGALGPKEFARRKFNEMMERARAADVSIGIESPHRFYHEIGDTTSYGEEIAPELFSNDYTRDEIVAKGWRKGCSVPWAHVIIGANGEVHPCCISPTVLGNLNDNSIDEIWFGPKYQSFRKALKSARPPRDCFQCRRAIWNPPTPLDTLREAMVVGEHEVHGLGWSHAFEARPGYKARHMGREATVFLKNGGRRMLSLTLGSQAARFIHGRIRVNDVPVGVFRVGPRWATFSFDLPQFASPVLKVTLTTDPRSPHLLVHAIQTEDTTRSWRVPAPVQSWVNLPLDVASVGWQAGRTGYAMLKPHMNGRGLKRGLVAVRGLLTHKT
ncbi:MAG: radical SAM protein [Chloroflexi bacterium]|nr:radical SAM protein [Chloroflexota bacterium]